MAYGGQRSDLANTDSDTMILGRRGYCDKGSTCGWLFGKGGNRSFYYESLS